MSNIDQELVREILEHDYDCMSWILEDKDTYLDVELEDGEVTKPLIVAFRKYGLEVCRISSAGWGKNGFTFSLEKLDNTKKLIQQ